MQKAVIWFLSHQIKRSHFFSISPIFSLHWVNSVNFQLILLFRQILERCLRSRLFSLISGREVGGEGVGPIATHHLLRDSHCEFPWISLSSHLCMVNHQSLFWAASFHKKCVRMSLPVNFSYTSQDNTGLITQKVGSLLRAQFTLTQKTHM